MRIGDIGNYYGGLHIFEKDGKCYWIIENYDTDLTDLSECEEIPRKLHSALKEFEFNKIINNIKSSKK